VKRLEAELARLDGRVTAEAESARRKALLPKPDVLDRVMRYEAHLARQLTHTLHTLERLQLTRRGTSPPPPAALDVTVEAGGIPAALVGPV
jgi:hypothetical protein